MAKKKRPTGEAAVWNGLFDYYLGDALGDIEDKELNPGQQQEFLRKLKLLSEGKAKVVPIKQESEEEKN